MSTSQLLKIKQTAETDTNSKLETPQESLLFVKKLVALGLSTIVYLRIKKIPESAFADRCENGLQLKILRDDPSCSCARRIVDWMKGCFDAIEKKYLRQMTLLIENEKDSSLVEAYNFRFKYPENGGASITQLGTFNNESESNEEIVTSSVIGMMRTIFILGQTLGPLPASLEISMELKYFDEVTPENYEPPGFLSAEKAVVDFNEEPLTFKVGDISTPFHCVKMRLKCKPSLYGLDNTKQEMDPSVVPDASVLRRRIPARIFPPLDVSHVSRKGTPKPPKVLESGTSPAPSLSIIDNYVTPKGSPSQRISNLTGSICSLRSGGLSTIEEKATFSVKCPCNIAKDHGLMILCDVCGYWQHSACFTIIEPSQAPDRHVCHGCADPPSLCTDPRLALADPFLVEVTCLFRRSLVAIYKSDESVLSVADLATTLGVDIDVSAKIVEKLISENVLTESPQSEDLKIINREVLISDLLPKYVRAVEGTQETQTSSPKSQASEATILPSLEEKENEEPLPPAHRLKIKKRKWNHSPKRASDYEISDSQNSSLKGRRAKTNKLA